MKFGIILLITILSAIFIMAIDWYFFMKRLKKERDEIKKMINKIKIDKQ